MTSPALTRVDREYIFMTRRKGRDMNKDEKTAVILLNMGGPESLDDVEPFLFNLFMDPDIIEMPLGGLLRPFLARMISKRRAGKVRGYYEKIGGKSPLREITEQQAASLEEALKKYGDFTAIVAMRYWHPFTGEAVEKALQVAPSHIILLPLYPQYSGTTSGSSINEFRRLWKKLGDNRTPVTVIEEWHDNDKYIKAWAQKIRKGLEEFKGSPPHLIFSAHGIPQKLVERGDPYQKQTEESIRLILKELEWKGPWSLSYQSRVGPVKWLEPATDELLVELGSKGVKDILMVPISFVSDHSETLYEMDIQYKELANGAGVERFSRVSSLNCSRHFIEALKDIVLKNIEEGQE